MEMDLEDNFRNQGNNQIYHLEGDVWLVPCIANYSTNTFQPLLEPLNACQLPDDFSKRQFWNSAEDDMLLKIVTNRGPKAWNSIAKELNAIFHGGQNVRLGRQCRERWYNHVDPGLKKGNWSPREDIHILEQQKVLGNKWSEIAKGLPGRTENSVKNRWKSMMKKAQKDWPRGLDYNNILLAQLKGQDIEFQEGDSINIVSPKLESRFLNASSDYTSSSPPSWFSQKQIMSINEVRNQLSSLTSMDLEASPFSFYVNKDMDQSPSPSTFLSL